METKFKIYTKKPIIVDGVAQEITSQVSSLTRADVVKSRDMVLQQRDRMQELLDITNRKLELIDIAITNNEDSIIL